MLAVSRAGRRRGVLVVGLYAFVLAVTPLLHHDLDCHLKSRSHCNACTANPLAPGAEPGPGADAVPLPEIEWVEAVRHEPPQAVGGVSLPARSPPA